MPLEPTLTLEQFRSRFPILLRRVYVNSCSQGALSVDVEAALHAFADSWHEHGSPWELWVEQVERLRELFARSIGADTAEVAVMPSASTAISAIATALRFDRRRRVAIGEFEFPTMVHVWLAAQRRGAEIVWIRADGDTLPASKYADAVGEDTLIVPATAICFRNGYRLDIPALASLCRRHGSYLFLDDYQRTGTGPIDVHELDIDFMVTGSLKYLLGASGIAFLYVRSTLVDSLEPLATGWFGRTNPFEFRIDRLDWAPTARRFEAGSPPVPNVYASIAGLELLQAVGYDAIERHIETLVERFIAGAWASGYRVVTPREPGRRGPLVVLPSLDAGELSRRLAGRGIVTSARGTGLRVSFHGYNDEQDVDAVLEGLAAESSLLDRRSGVAAT